jgi:hypothetical protein
MKGRTTMFRRHRIVLLAALASLGVMAAAWAAEVISEDRPQPVPPLTCLRKMSLDLTHRGPTDDQIARLESGATSLDEFADELLASPEFAQVSYDWMRREFPSTAKTAEIDIEEPSRLMHHILMQDRDWREIVTATYTVDAAGAELPITDRPAAGILTTPYYLGSVTGSLRRNWAGRFERQFAGIVLTPVTLEPGVAVDQSRDGLASNPACAGCHVHPVHGIDSLALFAECYDGPARIDGCVDPEGAFLMQTGAGLVDLGQITASTNEFKSTSINFFFKRLFGRDIAREEAAFYSEAAHAFNDSEFRARPLIKFIVTSDAYCSR